MIKLLTPLGKLLSELTGTAIGRMAHFMGFDTGCSQRTGRFFSDGSDGNVVSAKLEQFFRIRQPYGEFVIGRRAVGKGRVLMRMEREDIPQEDLPGIKAVVDDGAPDVGVCRLVQALFALRAVRKVWRLGVTGPPSLMAQDHGTGNLFVMVQQHPFARNSNAGKAATLVSGCFGDEEI